MKTTTIEKKSLLANAFEVLLDHLGPEKTNRVWQVLNSSRADYPRIRTKIFAGKSLISLYREARKFNR